MRGGKASWGTGASFLCAGTAFVITACGPGRLPGEGPPAVAWDAAPPGSADGGSAEIAPPLTRDPTCAGVVGEVAPSTSCGRSEEHTSELQSLRHLVCRLLLGK